MLFKNALHKCLQYFKWIPGFIMLNRLPVWCIIYAANLGDGHRGAGSRRWLDLFAIEDWNCVVDSYYEHAAQQHCVGTIHEPALRATGAYKESIDMFKTLLPYECIAIHRTPVPWQCFCAILSDTYRSIRAYRKKALAAWLQLFNFCCDMTEHTHP